MTGSACSSPSSCRTPWRTSSRAGASSISSPAAAASATLPRHARLSRAHAATRARPRSCDVLREEAAATVPFELEPVRYRETRSVGMVVLADPSGRATDLAGRLHARLERLGVYAPEQRPWLPHVTVLRFRARPKLEPPLPGSRRVRSVRGRCFPFTSAPDRGALRDPRIVFARKSTRRLIPKPTGREAAGFTDLSRDGCAIDNAGG